MTGCQGFLPPCFSFPESHGQEKGECKQHSEHQQAQFIHIIEVSQFYQHGFRGEKNDSGNGDKKC